MSEPASEARMDRSRFAATTPEAQDAETRAYWLAKTPEERIAGLERLRMIHYGYDPTTARLQRVLRVLPPGEG